MQKWEYKSLVLGYESEKKLNQLGEQGWELVSVAVDVSGDAYNTSSTIVAYLKRQISN